MYLVAIAWLYVVVMMAVAEAMSPQGTVLGAIITLLFYGLLPLAVLLYIMGTPARKRARLRAQQAEAEAEAEQAAAAASAAPDGGSHAAGDAITPERKEV